MNIKLRENYENISIKTNSFLYSVSWYGRAH